MEPISRNTSVATQISLGNLLCYWIKSEPGVDILEGSRGSCHNLGRWQDGLFGKTGNPAAVAFRSSKKFTFEKINFLVSNHIKN